MNLKTIGKLVFAFIFGIFVLLMIWGVLIEPRLVDERNESVAIPHLPSVWEGKRIALIADLQVGMWLDNTDTVRRIVERLIAERPAAVLIAGDFIYKPTGEDEREDAREEVGEESEKEEARTEIAKAVDLVRPLVQAGIPVYAVLGNHDFAMNSPGDVWLAWLGEEVRQNLSTAGIRVLQNEAVEMQPPEQSETQHGKSKLYLVGVGPKWVDRSDPTAALSQLPEGVPRVVMMHNPESFEDFPPQTAPIAMAGHTHGGQIRIPFLQDWSWMSLFSNDKIYADGWIDGVGHQGNRLYVNRGIGFSVLPVRIMCRPELTFFTLRQHNNEQ